MRPISMLRKVGSVVLVLVGAMVGISFVLQRQNTANVSDSLIRRGNTAAQSNTTTARIPAEASDAGEPGDRPGGNSTTQPDRRNYVSGTGTIKFLYFEGGFYGIVSDDGKQYDPGSLDQEFQIDGLRVKFEAETMRGMATIRMWGTPVSIIRIEKLEG